MEKETLHKEEIEVIFKNVATRPKRPAWTGSSDRAPSRIPPVEIKKRKKGSVENSEVASKPKRKKKAATQE